MINKHDHYSGDCESATEHFSSAHFILIESISWFRLSFSKMLMVDPIL